MERLFSVNALQFIFLMDIRTNRKREEKLEEAEREKQEKVNKLLRIFS